MAVLKVSELTDGEIKRELSDDSTADDRKRALRAEVADRAAKRSKKEPWFPGRFA